MGNKLNSKVKGVEGRKRQIQSQSREAMCSNFQGLGLEGEKGGMEE